MKKSSLILAIIFLISMCSFQRIEAQEKSKEEKDKELQELIDEQKKAMVEQKKVQEEAMRDARKEIEKSNFEVQKAMENLKDLKVDVENPEFQDQIMRVYRNYNGNRSFSTGEPFMYTPGFEFYGRHSGEDSERTSWEFSKSIKETSFDRDYIIDVEKSVSNVVMSIVGDCKMGEIRIKIIMPNGKTYSDIVIDEFGNLNWKKSFNVSESENEDKTGPWKFEIKSSKSIGYFKISLQTY
jgi:hypothetical protein